MTAAAPKHFSVPYLGNKAPYLHLFCSLLGRARVPRFVDMTAGGGSVASHFVHRYGTRSLVLNDVSPYPHLIAEALYGPRHTEAAIKALVEYVQPKPGFVSQSPKLAREFRPDTAAFIDAYCATHRGSSFALLGLAAAITQRAPMYSCFLGTRDMDTATLKREVLRHLRRIERFIMPLPDGVAHWAVDYLNPPEQFFERAAGALVYWDPAWPTPKGRHKTNEQAYGFYAVTLMSVLRQRPQPMPAEYAVGEARFREFMRTTIMRLLARKCRVLVAYQSVDDEIEAVEAALFSGLRIAGRASSNKNATSTLREYLYEVAQEAP